MFDSDQAIVAIAAAEYAMLCDLFGSVARGHHLLVDLSIAISSARVFRECHGLRCLFGCPTAQSIENAVVYYKIVSAVPTVLL